MPLPELQVDFWDDAGFIGRTDFYLPQLRIIGECDGAVKYAVSAQQSSKQVVDALLREKSRETRLRRHGDVRDVFRWGWAEAFDPSRFFDILVAAGIHPVAEGGWPLPPGPLPSNAYFADRLR